MPYIDKQAIYGLNGFTWKLQESNLGLVKTSYGGRSNIIPANQEPEFLAYGKPFIVYGSAIQSSAKLYPVRTEHVAYTIYAPTVSEVNRITNLLAQAFERHDESADDVNVWLRAERLAGNATRAGIRFGSIRVLQAEFAEPRQQEGGWLSGQVMLETMYTVVNDTIQTTGFTV